MPLSHYHDAAIVRPNQRRRARPKEAFAPDAWIVEAVELHGAAVLRDSHGYLCFTCNTRFDTINEAILAAHRHPKDAA